MLYLMKQVLTKGICTEPPPQPTGAWHVDGEHLLCTFSRRGAGACEWRRQRFG